jgi:hypothetical protein
VRYDFTAWVEIRDLETFGTLKHTKGPKEEKNRYLLGFFGISCTEILTIHQEKQSPSKDTEENWFPPEEFSP